jgi:DNA-binding transcriptional LysR family regulator
MQTARDVLTPDALAMLQAIAGAGSFAAAARAMGMVPSALTYRVRQIEDALDVLLYDRSSRQAKLTRSRRRTAARRARACCKRSTQWPTGSNASPPGWEPQLTIAVDTIISKATVMELCESFFSLNRRPPASAARRNPVRHAGGADLRARPTWPLASRWTGQQPRHAQQAAGQHGLCLCRGTPPPAGHAPEPLSDALIQQHRAVAVADSVQRGRWADLWAAQRAGCVHGRHHAGQAGRPAARPGRRLPAAVHGRPLHRNRPPGGQEDRTPAAPGVHVSYAWRGANSHPGPRPAMVAAATGKPDHTRRTAGTAPRKFMSTGAHSRINWHKQPSTLGDNPHDRFPTHCHRWSRYGRSHLRAHPGAGRPPRSPCSRRAIPWAVAWPRATARLAPLTPARSTSPCGTRALCKPANHAQCVQGAGAPTPCRCSMHMAAWLPPACPRASPIGCPCPGMSTLVRRWAQPLVASQSLELNTQVTTLSATR